MGLDGEGPYADLTQGTDGKFYGTTGGGGASGYGVVFSLSTGLGPFVQTRPTSGKVGAAVAILGTDLTGATSVTFNGTAATFTVVSSSEITTKVPTGATTGEVEVTTPGGTLSSNVKFRVRSGKAKYESGLVPAPFLSRKLPTRCTSLAFLFLLTAFQRSPVTASLVLS